MERGGVSVIIPNLNYPLVGEVVDEVTRQAEGAPPCCSGYEIIVVGRDDIGALAGRRHVDFVQTPGPVLSGTARNLGLKAARYELIVFLDADCIPQPGWLPALVQHQSEHDCLVSGSICLEADDYWHLCGNIAEFRENLSTRPTQPRTYLDSFSLAGRKSVFLETGGFDETLRNAQDIDLTARLYERGHRLCFEPRARVIHRPPRQSLRALLSYSTRWGGNSIRVRARHPGAFSTPGFAFNWVALLLLSPFIATASTLQTYVGNPAVLRYWHAAPVVLAMKLISTLSACRSVRQRKARGW